MGEGMKFPPDIPVYGDPKWRGKCPRESHEQISFFNQIRRVYPETWGRLAVHIRNEDGSAGARQVNRMKMEGLTTGASDIQIPGNPGFVCEMKRLDHTQSTISDDQVKYLIAAQDAGAFACIALGAVGAWTAFEDWLTVQNG